MQEKKIITFDDLPINDEIPLSQFSTLQGEIVQIRGFWYPLSSEEGVLAPQPNLKSCCLKGDVLVKQHLIVKGEVSSFPAQRALTVEGTFSIKENSHGAHNHKRIYILEKAIIAPPSTFSEYSSLLNIIAVIIIVALIFCLGRRVVTRTKKLK